MKTSKIKYCYNAIKFWLTQATLVLSIFLFSGFSLECRSTLNQPVKIELVDSNDQGQASVTEIDWVKYGRAFLPLAVLVDQPFNIWALLNYNNVLNYRIKHYKHRIMNFRIIHIKMFFKLPLPRTGKPASLLCS